MGRNALSRLPDPTNVARYVRDRDQQRWRRSVGSNPLAPTIQVGSAYPCGVSCWHSPILEIRVARSTGDTLAGTRPHRTTPGTRDSSMPALVHPAGPTCARPQPDDELGIGAYSRRGAMKLA
jgi:hypothetical protein